MTIIAEERLRQAEWIDDDWDETAVIESFVHNYYDDVQRLALSILQDSEEAADATQETFIKAVTNLKNYRGDANPKTWLFAIAINQCRQMLRKKKSRQGLKTTLQRLTNLITKSPNPEEQIALSETDEQLWTAVHQLKEKHQLPIILYYVHNLSTQEIAQILNSRPGTIQSRLHYGRQELHGKLSQTNYFYEQIGEDLS